MSQITKIELQKKAKDRYNIYLDGKYSFAVSVDNLVQYKLKEGSLLEQSELQQIISEENLVKTYNKILLFISYQIRTKKEIELKLSKILEKNVVDLAERIKIIEKIMFRLESAGFIDDLSYAKSYIESSKKASKMKIKNFLLRKGVPFSIIDEALETYNQEDDFDKAQVFYEKKLRQISPDDPQRIAKLYRFLLGKGFSMDTIKKIVSV